MSRSFRLSKPRRPILLIAGVLIVIGVAGAALGIGALIPAPKARALDAWNPGMIISDSVFYDLTSFSSAQGIQDFINSHTPATCDTWGTQPSEYGGGTRAQYAESQGWGSPPYVCLQNYYENPTTHETSFDHGGGAFSGGESVGQIIWDAAHTYNINPEVLLVTLKKEDGMLYTDDWPIRSEYSYAMGYGCPDTGTNNSANCSTNYAGLYNQINLAAHQYRLYATNPTQYSYKAGASNYIQYSPDASCGGSWVTIQNQATASLYNYTPYQPNNASLAAYPGTATCGSYGNRNFWHYFDEWFGALNVYTDQKVAITTRYQQLGGTGSVLGTAIDDVYCYTKDANKWCVQRYQNGYIISGKYGAWESYGPIRDRWAALGYENGVLGYPRDQVYCYTKNTDQWCVQRYENGYIISGKYGAWESYGPIRDRWAALGYENGTMGYPTGPVTTTSYGSTQTYENGSIVNSQYGAWESYGPIRTRWGQLGYDSGVLGVPRDQVYCYTKNTDQWCVQRYANGYIISGKYGAWESYGPIRTRWGQLGYENGVLGYPRDQVYCYTKNTDQWCVQRYENGYIISGKYGAWESYGPIRDRWAALGYENGVLGYPRDQVYCYTKNTDQWCVQRYENGYIISGKYGAWESYGPIRDRWAALGYENGVLGYPRDQVYCYTKNTDQWCVQRYENGYIISGKYGAWESYGDIRSRWATLGYENGVLGYPKGPVTTTTYGTTQEFENGVIMDSKYGAIENYGPIRTRYTALGNEAGVLGLPRETTYCYTKGTDQWCVQRFENGYIISGKYGAWESYGPIRTKWASMGYENGVLGYPTGPVTTTANGATQTYEHGTLTYTSSDGSVAVTMSN